MERKGLYRNSIHRSYFSDLYHLILSSSWLEFFLINITLYIGINVLFAFFYYLGGDSIVNATPNSFWDAFAFSFQTSSTIGYGHFFPANTYADVLVMFDALLGILFVAITTGLTFAKFSKPRARVIFSRNCVINELNGEKSLMFQMANVRDSHMTHVSIEAAVVYFKPESEDISGMESFFDLKLVQSQSPVFFMNWILVHIIDSKSPLYGLDLEELKGKEVRIVVSLTGIDDHSSQNVYASHIFESEDFAYNKTFSNIMNRKEDGSIVMDYNKIHHLQEL